jgi:hypothetical protein
MKKLFLPLALLGLAAVSNAQIIWDNTASTTSFTTRGASDAPALQITNSNSYAIDLTNVAFLGTNSVEQNFDFFLADSSGNVLNNVISAEGSSSNVILFNSPVQWVLAPNSTYFIGASSQSAGETFNYDIVSTQQNGLNGVVANGNFTGYYPPVFVSTAHAEMSWRLIGTAATPEPASTALIGFGAVALIRRRRKSA